MGFCRGRLLEKPPVPFVALLASEAPGRIAWALDQGADALIAKPVSASGCLSGIGMATRRHAEARQLNERIARLEERVRLRPLVHAAVQNARSRMAATRTRLMAGCVREAMRTSGFTLEQPAASDAHKPPEASGMKRAFAEIARQPATCVAVLP